MTSKPWRNRARRMSGDDSSTEDLISKQHRSNSSGTHDDDDISDATDDDATQAQLTTSSPQHRLRFEDNTAVVIQFSDAGGRGVTTNGGGALSGGGGNHKCRDFKSWRKVVNLSFLVLALVLLLIAVVFMSLYFHQRTLLEQLKKQQHSTSAQQHIAPSNNSVCVTSGCVEAAAAMQSAMDVTIDPCEDFYLYSCAGWIKKNPIPEGESSWDTISVVNKRNERIMKDILEDPRVKRPSDVPTKAEYRAYKIFRSCKDTVAINKMGTQPLVSLMNEIANFVPVNSTEQPKHSTVMELLKTLHDHTFMQLLFSVSVGPDDKNSTANILQFRQAGLSVAAYIYNENDTDTRLIAKRLKEYAVALASKIENQLVSVKELEEMIQDVYQFEKSLQQIFVPPKDMVTIDQIYHKTTIKQLQQISSDKINWLEYVQHMFKDTGVKFTEDEPIVVYHLEYFKRLKNFTENIDMKTVNNYAVFHVLSAYSSFLTEDVIALKKNLTIAATGSYKKYPRWRRCVAVTDGSVGFALGALFVKRAFSEDSFGVSNNLVDRVRNAFIDGLKDLPWMDEITKLLAEDKAKAIIQKIGYPEFIVDEQQLEEHYNGLEFKETEYFQNILNEQKWSTGRALRRLREPVDPTVWYMTPPTVNAYYEPTENQIVFPAGILQPPYFKSDYPKSVNYGMMGAIIGHEITHGFDNNGRQYDKHGNYVPSWWSPNVVKAYKKKAQCFVDEYSRFRLAGKNIKGNETLGENIADNGGVKAAYRAYKEDTRQNGEEESLPGVNLNNDQAFFVAFAQSWCTEELTKALARQIETDSHSPAIERVRGSIQNNYDFARVFKCPVGSQMNPEKKCEIW